MLTKNGSEAGDYPPPIVPPTGSINPPLDPGGWLAAIIESSDDAILSKTLDGVITSWNPGAEKLFGYTAQEAVGQSITIVIPQERLAEEEEIISKIRAGLRVEHFETVRRRKDGSLVDVSLTISPVMGQDGRILGASKIARDITASRLLVERQTLLLREMHHRIKNLFAVTLGLIRLSGRAATSVATLVDELSARMASLARAHELTLPEVSAEEMTPEATALQALLQAVLAPHEIAAAPRIAISGCDLPVSTRIMPSLALMLHEFATNSAKYGALSVDQGTLDIALSSTADNLTLLWTERGGPAPQPEKAVEGFGSKLEQASVLNLQARIERDWAVEGLSIRLDIPLKHLTT